MATSTTVSSKGQVVIPKEVRSAHHWTAGTELIVEDLGDAVLLRPRKLFSTTVLEVGLGCTGYRGPSHSIEEMAQGIDGALRKGWERR